MSGEAAEIALSEARRKAWWAKQTQASEPPPDAEKIAADLSFAAQGAILQGTPWALELDQSVAWELELLGLLDEDKISLSQMGVWVWRTIVRWDVDYAERQERFGAWFDQFYAAAYQSEAPGHAVTHAALFLHPDAHEAILDIAENVRRRGVVIGHPEDRKTIAYLKACGLVTFQPINDKFNAPLRVQATALGLGVAKLYRIEQKESECIFQGSKRSGGEAQLDKSLSRATERMTAILAQHFAVRQELERG